MTLKLNQIYKVKEGHEGKCGAYSHYDGKYIRIIEKNHSDYYEILGEDKKFIGWVCGCFTEDDLELEEEVKDTFDKSWLKNPIMPYIPLEKTEKSLEDLEVGDGYQKLTNYLFSRGHSITKPLIDDIWYYLQVETLLEEKLGIKVKIKN